MAAWSQPLERGLQAADGRHFLLDDGALRVVSKDFQTVEKIKTESLSALYQGSPEVWGSSFLAQTESGLARFNTTGPQLQPKILLEGEKLKVVPWGERFVVYPEGANKLLVVSAEGEKSITLRSGVEVFEVVSPDLAVVRSDKGLGLLRARAADVVIETVGLPFPLADAKVIVGGGRVLAWSPGSNNLVDLATARTFALPEQPTVGLRLLDDGSVVFAGAKSLWLIQDRRYRRFPRPAGVTPEAFAQWRMLFRQHELMVMMPKDERTQALHFRLRGNTPMDLLPTGEVSEIVLGPAGEALLFMTTLLKEPRVDDDGKLVYDPQAPNDAQGQPDPQQRTVNGHRIFELRDGHWKVIAEDPRAMLVGPIQRVGDRVIYATRTEPAHVEGQELEVDRRFPYPKVILHGRELRQPAQEWTFDKPRGEAPSKDRLPDGSWPVLGETGRLLITSEDDRLLAIDPAKGELAWSTEELEIDESAPPMWAWSDGLGLVATKSTGRELFMVNSQDGQIVDSLTLSPFFFWEKWRHLLGVIIICAALAYYIYAAGKRTLYIRQIAGLKALDEAVGRATEMGKPVLYVVGLADVDDIQTMASLSILSHVARKTAEYDTPIVTTTARAVAFSAAQEIVRDAFSVAGRPDAFSVESVRYISDDQFGYTAGVDGIMVREEPAANFYMGNFYAESLILAETGHATGSIQIAGTAQPSQVPFFVAACDYTLIGEELFAASAYLSRDPLQVGSLRGQDVGKAIVMVLLVVCSLLISMGVDLDTALKALHLEFLIV